MKHTSGNKPGSGFTLLEVLVAMTIVGLGVVTLLQIFSLGLRLQARSTARTEAVVQGTRVMDEILSRKRLNEGSERGNLGSAGRWTSSVQTSRDSSSSFGLSGNWQLKEVGLDMVIAQGAQERRLELKTLRLSRKPNP